MRIRRLLFYVGVSLFAMFLLYFVILNGNYIDLFNSKFMTLSLASTGTHSKALISDNDTDDDTDTDTDDITTSETVVSTSEVATSDVSNDTATISSDTASKYLDVDVYDISWGDTLSGISRLTGVSVDELAKLNNISNPNLIYSGSSIKIR